MPDQFPVQKNIIRKGAKVFVLFSILGLVFAYLIGEGIFNDSVSRSLDIRFLFLVILLTCFDYCLGGSRIFYISRVIGKKVSFLNCIKADWGNTFLSAMTPMQTGGGPAQLYILSQSGLNIGEAMAVSFVNFTFTVIFLFSISGFLVISGVEAIREGFVSNLFRFGFLFVCFLVGLSISIKFKPTIALWFIKGFKRITHAIFPKYEHAVEGFYIKLIEYLKIWWTYLLYLIRNKKIYLLGGLIITVVLFANKYTLAYFVIRGLGGDPNYFEVLFTMVILNALLYFSPSPGASGVAEIAAATVIGSLVPGISTISFTILWRFFTSYLGVGLGALVLIRAISNSIDSAWVVKPAVSSAVTSGYVEDVSGSASKL